jgi:hypothetical protein
MSFLQIKRAWNDLRIFTPAVKLAPPLLKSASSLKNSSLAGKRPGSISLLQGIVAGIQDTNIELKSGYSNTVVVLGFPVILSAWRLQDGHTETPEK